MGQGSVGICNGHSPLYLNLLHRMRDPMTITGDIMIIMGKQLQVKHFGAALQHIRDLKWWNLVKYSRTVDKDIDKDKNEDQPYSQSQKRSF